MGLICFASVWTLFIRLRRKNVCCPGLNMCRMFFSCGWLLLYQLFNPLSSTRRCQLSCRFGRTTHHYIIKQAGKIFLKTGAFLDLRMFSLWLYLINKRFLWIHKRFYYVYSLNASFLTWNSCLRGLSCVFLSLLLEIFNLSWLMMEHTLRITSRSFIGNDIYLWLMSGDVTLTQEIRVRSWVMLWLKWLLMKGFRPLLNALILGTSKTIHIFL